MIIGLSDLYYIILSKHVKMRKIYYLIFLLTVLRHVITSLVNIIVLAELVPAEGGAHHGPAPGLALVLTTSQELPRNLECR